MEYAGFNMRNRLIAAPMAGVSDRPFRQLCRSLGAGLSVSEMVASNPRTVGTRKSRLRLDHSGEPSPRIVQIAGGCPVDMAEAARRNVDAGADIIDINMGCPAKKVCRKAAGSALLENEPLVGRILDAVVRAVDVPVTLKTRTGPDADRRNCLRIAALAEACGIAVLTLHGRTRAQRFDGRAEHRSIRGIRAQCQLPLIANGDIDSPESAARVLAESGANGLMIGRAACRRPWLFREIQHFLDTGRHLPPPTLDEEYELLAGLLEQIHDFYGERDGVRMARKHLNWYFERVPDAAALRPDIMQAESSARQRHLFLRTFDLRARAAA
jgi:tRNA-dihydrouridine synthase B